MEAAELRVAWETDSMVNNSFMARNDVPKAIRDQVQSLVVHLQDTPQGRQILKNMETVRYTPATRADYEVVRTFMATFERRVRPAEQR